MSANNPVTTAQGKRTLEAIRKIRPFLPASLTVTLRKCGNPQCRCAREGPVHETALLTWKDAKTTRTLHVPRELRAEVRQWIQEWKKLKKLIAQMADAQRQCLQTLKKKRKSSSRSS
jgi:hypothetical protein